MFQKKTCYAFKYPRFSKWIIWEILKVWGSSFFWKCSEFYVHSKNAMKYPQKDVRFYDKYIWIGCAKFPVVWREHLASGDNGLTCNLKISDLTKRDIFRLYLYQSDEEAEWKFSSVDFCSVWETLTRWLAKDVLKQDLLCIQVSTFFRVINFGNT